MIQILIKKDTFTKNYLKGINQYEFDSLLDLVALLYQNNSIEDTNSDQTLLDYLNYCSYKSIDEIPKDELSIIESYYWKLKKLNSIDKEKYSYLLMASILKSEILIIIDSKLILDVNLKVSLNQNSLISLVHSNEINNYEFKTL